MQTNELDLFLIILREREKRESIAQSLTEFKTFDVHF